jgi:hypothetical protein
VIGVLKDSYQEWSDSLAGDTMRPLIKGVQITNALLPKTSGLVRAAADEADRFMTIVGGSINSPGLDSLNSRFTTFSRRTLRAVNDEIVHLLRLSESGEVGGNTRRFMDWARAQGPTVASVLQSVGTSLVNILDGASGVGVSLLQIVEAAARLVSAVPPGAVATFLQLALALKLTKAAAMGLVAARAALAGFGTSLVAMNTAAAAAPGRLAAVRAAILALSRTTKIAMAGTGIGLAILAISELSSKSESAPPDVDKLTESLRQLGATGKVTGEAAKAFGSDLDGLYDKVRSLTDPTTTDQVQQFLVGWTGWDSTPVKEAKENLGAVDDALANLVRTGQADLAAAALKRLTAEYGKGGRDTREFTNELDGYRTALADTRFEQQLAAQAMGIFGASAQDVQAKLNAQKVSADGLRQSILALNDANRSAYDAQIGFEQAVDDLTKSFQDNGATLDLNTEAGRKNGQAMSGAAKAHDEMIASGLAAGESLGSMTQKSDTLRASMLKLALDAFDGNKTKAQEYINTLLGAPGEIKTLVRLEKEEALTGLQNVQAEIARTPGAKEVHVSTLNGAAIKALEAVGLKTRQLPDGKTAVYTANGTALGAIGAVSKALSTLNGKTANTYTNHYTTNYVSTITRETFYKVPLMKGPAGATGGLYVGKEFRYADGGLVRGPGTGTSDDVFAPWLSNGEYVINARSTAKYRDLIDAINADRVGDGYGMPGAGSAVAQGLVSGMTGSTGQVGAAARLMASAITAGIKDEMEIASPSKKTKALAADIGRGLIVGLTGSQAKIKATAADLVKDIKTAFDGKKESSLVRWVDKQTKALLSAAARRDKVAGYIAAAKKYATETAQAARQGAGLNQLGLEPEQVTAGSIKGALGSKLAQLKQFTRYIDILKKRGLRGALLRQILDMGPEQGYAYASALVGASKQDLAQINKVDQQIEGAATSLGRTGADALWDAGKNASKGFLAGLTSQQKELEATMVRIAQSMQRALRKALGIRSPARAMIPDGVNTTRGVAVGVLAGLPHIDRAMQTVAGRMAGRAAIAAVLPGGGGSTTVTLSVQAGIGTDPIALSRELRRMLLELKRDYGVNVNLGVS